MFRSPCCSFPPSVGKTTRSQHGRFQRHSSSGLTAGIFLRIAAELAWEQHQSGRPLDQITPFWRVIEPKAPLAKKLACGIAFLTRQRKLEGLK